MIDTINKISEDARDFSVKTEGPPEGHDIAKLTTGGDLVKEIKRTEDPNSLKNIIREQIVAMMLDRKNQGQFSEEDVFTNQFQLAYLRNSILREALLRLSEITKVQGSKELIVLEQEALDQVLGSSRKAESSEMVDRLQESRRELMDFSVEEIPLAEGKKLMEKVRVHGSSFRGEELSVEILEKEGLEPKFKIRIGERVIWLASDPYQMDKGRAAIVAYVEKGQELVTRSFYRSNSQGIWRYLPNYRISEGGQISWFSKGNGEESVTLPVVMQKVLAEMSGSEKPLKQVADPELVFAGSARVLFEVRDGTYQLEIESLPKKLEGNFYSEEERGKVPPEEMQFGNPKQSPNFDRIIMSWEQQTDLYGKVLMEVFPSEDGSLIYLLCSDESGRAWVGGIEEEGEVQSTGLKKNWITGGDLTTPAFEYLQQSGGYGNKDLTKGGYVDMFKDYLSKVPLIQDYIESRQRRTAGDKTQSLKTSDLQKIYAMSDLFEAIAATDGARGAKQFYSSQELRTMIGSVMAGKADVSILPSEIGQKVSDIMRIDELKGRVAGM